MGRLSRLLDPMQTGPEAGRLDSNLHQCIVGQDDAIQQIVVVYQTYLAGMSSPGRPIAISLFGPDR
jgi:ATP-dependent Clp protease ATP-binding subunit ClpA